MIKCSHQSSNALIKTANGLVCSGLNGRTIPDPHSTAGAPLPGGTAAWLLSTRLQGADPSAAPQRDIDLITEVLELLLCRSHARIVLQGIGGLFSPLLKDLIRFLAVTLEEGAPGQATYRRVASSASFLAATRHWEAAQASESNA